MPALLTAYGGVIRQAMTDALIYILGSIICGTWLIFYPKQMMVVCSKYQLFMFRQFPGMPFFPFKSEEEAKQSIFNERAVRAVGYINYFVAIVIATKTTW